MKTIEINGVSRSDLGKQSSKRERREAFVPCVMYGDGGKCNHFSVHMSYLKRFFYTPNVFFVNINLDGKKYKTILQDSQMHPVSEMVMHMDFLQVFDEKAVSVSVPIKVEGESPGVMKGGLLTKKMRKIKVKGLPKNIPEFIPVDISGLELGESAKIRDIEAGEYSIVANPNSPVASVIVPRALKSKQGASSEEDAS